MDVLVEMSNEGANRLKILRFARLALYRRGLHSILIDHSDAKCA